MKRNECYYCEREITKCDECGKTLTGRNKVYGDWRHIFHYCKKCVKGFIDWL